MSDTPTAQPDVHLQVLLGQRLPPDPPAPLATARAVIAFAAQLRIHELLDIPLRALHLHGGSSAWLHRFGMDWNLGDLLSARRGDLNVARANLKPKGRTLPREYISLILIYGHVHFDMATSVDPIYFYFYVGLGHL